MKDEKFGQGNHPRALPLSAAAKYLPRMCVFLCQSLRTGII